MVLFGACVSLMMAAIFGLPFALRGSSRRPIDALRSRTSGGSAHSRSRSVLVTMEVTLTVMLLAGAGLLGRSLWSVLEVDPGFKPADVLTFRVSLPPAKYQDAAAHDAFYQTVLERIDALPGVVASGVTGALPLTGTPATTTEPEGSNATEQLSADVITATPGFFAVLQIPLRQGRLLATTDPSGGHTVAIVNGSGRATVLARWRQCARTNDHDERLGCAVSGGGRRRRRRCATGGTRCRCLASCVLPVRAIPGDDAERVNRGACNGQPAANDRGSQGSGVDGRSQSAHCRDPGDERDHGGIRCGAALQSSAALRLRAGSDSPERGRHLRYRRVCGYRAYSGDRRQAGARRPDARDLAILVLRHGARPVVAGIVAGVAGAIVASRVLETLLFGVRPTDAFTLAGVVITIALVAAGACTRPILRALRVDPVVALRIDQRSAELQLRVIRVARQFSAASVTRS